MRFFLIAPIALLAFGCARERSESAGAGPSPSPSAPALAPASAAPSAGSAAGAHAAPSGAADQWRGSYKSAAAQMYIPRGDDVPNAKEWENVKFRGDDAGIGLGDGTLSMTHDPATGRVTGTVDGPVGPALLYGTVQGGRFTATIARKDPSDLGLTGTAMGAVAGGKIEGIMKLAESNARVVREATFSLGRVP